MFSSGSMNVYLTISLMHLCSWNIFEYMLGNCRCPVWRFFTTWSITRIAVVIRRLCDPAPLQVMDVGGLWEHSCLRAACEKGVLSCAACGVLSLCSSLSGQRSAGCKKPLIPSPLNDTSVMTAADLDQMYFPLEERQPINIFGKTKQSFSRQPQNFGINEVEGRKYFS